MTVKLNGVNETLYLVRTSSENALGDRKNGRLVLSFTPDLDQQIGGLFFFEEAGEKQMQSLYLDPDLRGQGLMSMLARARPGNLALPRPRDHSVRRARRQYAATVSSSPQDKSHTTTYVNTFYGKRVD